MWYNILTQWEFAQSNCVRLHSQPTYNIIDSTGERHERRNAKDGFPRDLNIHDPDNKYRWQEEEAQAPAWVWAMRGLGVVGFVVGIYCLVFLGLLL